MTAYELLLPFDTDHPQFARGWETGLIYGRIERDRSGEFLIHAENREMCQRIADRFVVRVRFTDEEDGWVLAVFTDDLSALDAEKR